MVAMIVLIFALYGWAGEAGHPNPAVSYCIDLGYQSEVVTGNDGGQSSICILPEGKTCDVWAFYEGSCGAEYSYCAKNGYSLKVKTDGKDPFSKNYAVCVDRKTAGEIGTVTDLTGLKMKFRKSGKFEAEEFFPLKISIPSNQSLLAGATALMGAPPTSYDWRNYLSYDWMTSVKDQSACGACWAFSAVGASEAAYNIHANNPNLDINLSEEYLNSDCETVDGGADAGSCCGGGHDPAFDFIRDFGIPDEACLPFDVSYYGTGDCDCFGNPPCNVLCSGLPTNCSEHLCGARCADYATRRVKIKDYYSVPANQNDIKQNLVDKGPISVCLAMSGDFDANNVYNCTKCWDLDNDNICDSAAGTCNTTTNLCVSGLAGRRCNSDADCDEDKNNDGLCNQDDCGVNHCVVITGYDDATSVWHVKNSWGATWHGNGYFDVGYGECHIEAYPRYAEAADMEFPLLSIPGNIAFDLTCVGSANFKTLDVCNIGKADLQIRSITSSDPQFIVPVPITGYPVIISPDFCYPFQVSFSPTSTGQKTTTLTIHSNDIGHPSVTIQASGNGGQQQVSAFIADNGNFGDVCLGTLKDMDLTISNSGGCSLSITGISSNSAQFIIPTGIAFPLVISPGGSAKIPVRFQPTSTGAKSGNITITGNAPSSPTSVAVSGNAPAPAIGTAIANTGNFGDVCLGTFKDLALTINNPGGCNLSVSSISSSSGEFIAPGLISPLIVSPGGSTSVTLRFQPTSTGAKSGNITITGNAPSSPTSVAVSGNAPAGDIRVTGSTDFGDVCAGTDAEKTISVCNVGKCNLAVTSAAFNPACPDFSIINNPFPATASPDSCMDVVILFTPASDGPKSCTLVIASDDPDQPAITLTVTANTPIPSIDIPSNLSFPPTVIQSVGNCLSQKSFPISNTGTCNLTITDISITNNSAEYSLAGRPSLPIILEPGHIAGEGDLMTVFNPTVLDRERTGQLTVTYETDPITHVTTSVTRDFCGEGTMTGARVLVTESGTPLLSVEQIKIQRLGGNRNRNIVDTVDVAKDLALRTVTQDPPCATFQFHREYGTVSNPIQLLPGDYTITATAIINGKRKSKTVGFNVDTCGFNRNIEIKF